MKANRLPSARFPEYLRERGLQHDSFREAFEVLVAGKDFAGIAPGGGEDEGVCQSKIRLPDFLFGMDFAGKSSDQRVCGADSGVVLQSGDGQPGVSSRPEKLADDLRHGYGAGEDRVSRIFHNVSYSCSFGASV